MIRRSVARLARMDAAEIAWRLKTGSRVVIDRAAMAFVRPRWNRAHLASALAPLPGLSSARAALAGHGWHDAHRELSRYFAHAPQQFVAGHATRRPLVERILHTFPDSARQAAARADRILAGEYDLLGYGGLRFPSMSPSATGDIDWHLDPVHERRAPRTFWSTVPYLQPACGDHKIIWELNRHQHWLTLGRAFWLTGDARYRDRFVAELTSWIDANPPLVGINWASMLELALRSISWLWALCLFVEDPERTEREGHEADRAPWVVDLLLGLDRQLTHIEHNLSYYFSPNTHLSGEALALYVSGLTLPELSASARRADVGRRVLLAEIDRQIASDGGHRERSTHYHRYTLDFYLLALIVARIHRDPAAAEFERAVSRLGFAARLLADDRGRMPHIGDDDGGALLPMTGRAPDDLRDSLAVAAALVHRPDLSAGRVPEEALWLLGHERLAEPHAPSPASSDAAPPAGSSSGALVETGYYVSRSNTFDHLVIDGGLHGYQNGGHAHADALSLTFSVGGVPLLIDPGTACYTIDRVLRDRFRSTALHNTLTIDDRPQSVSNGPFHWSHTANSRVRRWRTNEAFDYFDGAHDGYQPTTHRRRVLALHGDLLIVADLVDGGGPHRAAVHWHVDPRVDASTPRAARLHRLDRRRRRVGLVVPAGRRRRVRGRRRDRARLAFAGVRPRRAGDDGSRELVRKRAVLDGQRVRSRPGESGRRRRLGAGLGRSRRARSRRGDSHHARRVDRLSRVVRERRDSGPTRRGEPGARRRDRNRRAHALSARDDVASGCARRRLDGRGRWSGLLPLAPVPRIARRRRSTKNAEDKRTSEPKNQEPRTDVRHRRFRRVVHHGLTVRPRREPRARASHVRGHPASRARTMRACGWTRAWRSACAG